MPPGNRNTPRPSGYGASQHPTQARPRTTPASAYGDRYAAQAKMWDDQSEKDAYSAAQNAGGPAAAADPWGNMTPDQYFAALMGAGGVSGSGGSGSGGVGGGGGSGRPGDPDPLGWNAIAQQQALEKGYAEMLAAQDAKTAALQAGFDTRTTGLNSANQAGAEQMARLQAQLAQQAAGTRGEVAGSYQGGQAALQGILGQYQQMIQGRQAPAAQTLQAFGAAPGAAVSDPSGVQNMLVAQQANLARVGQADDALFANRGNVYNGLNQDVTTQRQQGFDMLMAKLLAEQQATSAASASERAQLAMQQQQAMLQLQAQEQARKASYG
jgi:hypothetical protein